MATGPWDILLQTGADALIERLRARIRSKEAVQAHEHALEDAAVKAESQERSAQADFARAWQAEEHTAAVRLWEQVTLHAERMRQEASPFKLPGEDIRSIAEAATRKGELPALIIAPFLDRLGGAAGIGVCRQLWWRAQQRVDWTKGLAGLSGHMRPVSELDIDVDLIRDMLAGLPFVLIHGDVEVDQFQVRILGLGVLPSPDIKPIATRGFRDRSRGEHRSCGEHLRNTAVARCSRRLPTDRRHDRYRARMRWRAWRGIPSCANAATSPVA